MARGMAIFRFKTIQETPPEVRPLEGPNSHLQTKGIWIIWKTSAECLFQNHARNLPKEI